MQPDNPDLDSMRREFERRLTDCRALQARYLRAIDDKACSPEDAGMQWRALSNALGELARDYPVSLLWRCAP